MPPFSVISGANFTVAGFSTTNVVIQFSPTSVGAASNNIVFNSDNGGGVNILVTGTAAIVPQAGFTASPTIGTVPLTVTFNDTSTGTITNRFWNFGDGAVNSTTTNIVTHTYTLAGANTVILTVTGPVGTSSATNYNYIVATNQYYTYIINNGTLTITGYNGPGGDLTIPDKINGLPVTSIGNYAFYYNASLTSVFIPSSVTNIGVGVFYACTGLTAIIVDAYNPVYVSLAGVLFDKNRNTLIQCPVGETGTYLIPDSVTNIGFGAFVDCFALTNVVFGTNVTSIGDHAFDSSGLTSALIGNSVITIGNSAFGGCPSLTSVTIPNSVTNVGGSAFEHCRSLTNVTIGNNVICIGDTAFGGCWSLTSVTIPNSVIQIGTGGYGAFVECVGLIRVSIGNGVTKIGDGTFYGCTALAIVTVGNSLTNIGDGAFYYCASLTGIYFKGNTPTLGGTNVFTYATNAIVYYLPGTSGWGATFAGCPTALWNPVVQTGNGSLGIQTNQFRFKIAGTTNIPVVVEASTNLGGAWIPLQSVNLTNGSFYFSDSQWTNYPGRFYRIRSP
jgi:PKD repeat protein